MVVNPKALAPWFSFMYKQAWVLFVCLFLILKSENIFSSLQIIKNCQQNLYYVVTALKFLLSSCEILRFICITKQNLQTSCCFWTLGFQNKKKHLPGFATQVFGEVHGRPISDATGKLLQMFLNTKLLFSSGPFCQCFD